MDAFNVWQIHTAYQAVLQDVAIPFHVKFAHQILIVNKSQINLNVILKLDVFNALVIVNAPRNQLLYAILIIINVFYVKILLTVHIYKIKINANHLLAVLIVYKIHIVLINKIVDVN